MWVRQAFDGAPIAEVARGRCRDSDGKARSRDPVFRRSPRLASSLSSASRSCAASRGLMQREFDALAMLIAREGGKPLSDARVETTRAINGVEVPPAKWSISPGAKSRWA